MTNEAWAEKYIPKERTDLLIPSNPPLVDVNYLVNHLLSTGSCLYAGFVLYGNGGSGKTTFANYLKTNLNNYVTFNVKDTGAGKAEIDEIERTIQINECGIFDNKVLIIANELSQSSKEFRDGLRGIIDRYRSRIFIIATDNNIAKLRIENPQLVGVRRLLEIDWDLIPASAIVERCSRILAQENELDKESYDRLVLLANKYSPDIGSVIQTLQLFVEARREKNGKV